MIAIHTRLKLSENLLWLIPVHYKCSSSYFTITLCALHRDEIGKMKKILTRGNFKIIFIKNLKWRIIMKVTSEWPSMISCTAKNALYHLNYLYYVIIMLNWHRGKNNLNLVLPIHRCVLHCKLGTFPSFWKKNHKHIMPILGWDSNSRPLQF